MRVLKLHDTVGKAVRDRIDFVRIEYGGLGCPHKVARKKLLQLIQLILGAIDLIDCMRADLPLVRLKKENGLQRQIILRILPVKRETLLSRGDFRYGVLNRHNLLAQASAMDYHLFLCAVVRQFNPYFHSRSVFLPL